GVQLVRRRQRRDEAATRGLVRDRPRRRDVGSLPRSLLDVLRAHRRSPATHRDLAEQSRRWARLPEERHHRRFAGYCRGTGSGYGENRRQLSMRVENDRGEPREAARLPFIREFRRAGSERGIRARARSAPPRLLERKAKPGGNAQDPPPCVVCLKGSFESCPCQPW